MPIKPPPIIMQSAIHTSYVRYSCNYSAKVKLARDTLVTVQVASKIRQFKTENVSIHRYASIF